MAAALTLGSGASVSVSACFLDTDGSDGGTDAAGAVVDGRSATRAREAGIDLEAAVAGHRSGEALAGLGDLIVTGPTQTNVNDMFVLAGRAKIGALFGPALAQIPPDRLFFAGGGGSVRGYGFKSIGVDTPGGVVGGRYLVEGSLEARVKVTKDIGVVGFLDGGYVAADSFPGLDQLRLGQRPGQELDLEAAVGEDLDGERVDVLEQQRLHPHDDRPAAAAHRTDDVRRTGL